MESVAMGTRPYELGDSFTISPAPSVQPAYSPRSNMGNKRPLRTYLLNGEYEKPWINDKRLRRTRVGNYIIWGFIVLSLALSAYYNYAETLKVDKYQYCLVLEDRFLSFNTSVWNSEVQVNGYGNGVFDWTTTDHKNSFIDSEGLHIIPTLTNQTTPITNTQIYNGYTLNLTEAGDGSCTGTTNTECSVHSNRSIGAVIPPVRSARINTKGTKSILYGRVEVVARLPRGDWLWPAIWMLPVNDTYGPWPASGEIDIVESRGNGIKYQAGGRNVMSSALHWGPLSKLDAYWRTIGSRSMQRGDYSDGFHTYGLVWTHDKIYSYVDNPLQRVLETSFSKNKDMWQKGHFAGETVNSSLVHNPWSQTGRPNTPFDQPFYLVMNVAVGGTNGIFPDGIGNKPWVDGPHAASQFYRAVDQWYPSWPSDSQFTHRGMTVKSLKMWQQGPCSQGGKLSCYGVYSYFTSYVDDRLKDKTYLTGIIIEQN